MATSPSHVWPLLAGLQPGWPSFLSSAVPHALSPRGLELSAHLLLSPSSRSMGLSDQRKSTNSEAESGMGITGGGVAEDKYPDPKQTDHPQCCGSPHRSVSQCWRSPGLNRRPAGPCRAPGKDVRPKSPLSDLEMPSRSSLLF